MLSRRERYLHDKTFDNSCWQLYTLHCEKGAVGKFRSHLIDLIDREKLVSEAYANTVR